MKFFYWAPRILSIGFVLFISIFALDVFSTYSGVATILPLFMQLLPSFMLLITTALAWRYELIGTIIFLGFAIFYVWDVGFTRPLSVYLVIVLPAFIVGTLYLISWLQKNTFLKNKQYSFRNSSYKLSKIIPEDGKYMPEVTIEQPQVGKHDENKGNRYKESITVELPPVSIKTGRKEYGPE